MKRKLSSRFLSLFLALALVVGTLPVALATEESSRPQDVTIGEGEDASPQETPNEEPTDDPNGEDVTDPDDKPDPEPIKVDSVSLDAATLELEIGESSDLEATVSPADAENQGVSWSSSNSAVATVSGGTVTAKGEGEAVITVTTDEGGKTATCRVTVNAPSPISVTGVELSQTNMTLTVGKKTKLQATVNPADASNQKVSWSADAPSIATVDQSGNVTAVRDGSTTIRVRTQDGEYEATCSLVVESGATVPTLTLNKSSLALVSGGNETLSATTNPAGVGVSWTTSNGNVATVSQSGKVTAVGTGTAVITATPTGGTSASCTVTVGQVTAPTLSRTSLSVKVGKSSALSVNNLPAGATVAWSTNTGNIVTLKTSGTGNVNCSVTGVTAGKSVTITALVKNGQGGQIASLKCTVSVTAASATDITYSVDGEEYVDFVASHFNNVCTDVYGKALSYVIFDLPSSSRGTLYYNYDDGAYDRKVSDSTKYYYNGSSSRAYLSKVTFVPDEDYSGTVTISYSAVDASGNSYTGSVIIKVEDASSEIAYSAGLNEPIVFDSEDFDDLCDSITGRTLDYVKFTLPSSNRGVLYYDYDDGNYDSKVSASKKYYYDDSPNLSDITFVPAKNWSGTLSISFTGEDSKGKSFSGTVKITVSKTGGGDIDYTVAKGGSVDFDIDDFNDYSKDETNASLNYVTFTPPSSSKGTLYYQYDDGDFDSKVTSSEKYYRSKRPYISDVTFVPAKNYTGTVSISFDGWNSNGKKFSGTIKINVGNVDQGDIVYSAAVGTTIELDVDDFNRFCKSETNSNLRYVKFTLPTSSKGILYGADDKKISNTTEYYRDQKPYLDEVTFVPAKNMTGNVSIDFTGRSVGGKNFSGTLLLKYASVKEPEVLRYATSGQAVYFTSAEFIAACNARGVGALSSVRFQLPSESTGTLYENYISSASFEGRVTAGTSYAAASLGKICFVPKAGFSGTATITYTGTDKNDLTYTGYVQVVVSTPAGGLPFTDLGNHGWAVDAVEYLYKNGITTGTTATTYGPAGSITRGDFVLMLARAFGFLGSSGTALNDNFKDVPADSYYAQAIYSAKQMGIAQGSNDGNFNPKAPLTREDAMVLLQRTLNRTGRGIAEGTDSTLANFPDRGKISSYAQGSVAALVQAGIIKGDNTGNLQPKGTLTRAEMAVILYRVLAL